MKRLLLTLFLSCCVTLGTLGCGGGNDSEPPEGGFQPPPTDNPGIEGGKDANKDSSDVPPPP